MDTATLRGVIPKQVRTSPGDWQGFFPYYAGFPLGFAEKAIEYGDIKKHSTVFDPWNGSGTTTFAASDAGYNAIGFDLNPVMVVVARARALPITEVDSLHPIALQLISLTKTGQAEVDESDPLLDWFEPFTAGAIRSIERSICKLLIGNHTLTPAGVELRMLSSIGAAYYVALFSSVRSLLYSLKTTNPTWIKAPKTPEDRLDHGAAAVINGFMSAVDNMAASLVRGRKLPFYQSAEKGHIEIRNCDSSKSTLPEGSVDFIITSPPYCTRLDYAHLTRIELAILSCLVPCSYEELKVQLLGSVIAPRKDIEVDEDWGTDCLNFLKQIKSHQSKASSGYYHRNHVDYFDKLFRSLKNAAFSLRTGGKGVVVVQDSFYKDIHNPLQRIVTNMMKEHGLDLLEQYDYSVKQSMASRHQHAAKYRSSVRATESVLCVLKQ